MDSILLALVLSQVSFFGPKAPLAQVRTVQTEKLRTPNGMPDVYVVRDDLRGVTCYITHSSEGGGGIFCLVTPPVAIEKGK